MFLTCKPDLLGTPRVYLQLILDSYRNDANPAGFCRHSQEVPATTLTCSPFLATFDFPSLEPVACPTRAGIFPPITITVSE